MGNASVLLGFVGDLLVDRPQPPEVFDAIADVLNCPDILFGNLEASFTDDPHPAPSGGTPIFPGARNLDVFRPAGFDVLSMANNHIVDAGHAALLENLARLKAQGMATCGAGATLSQAREPAILLRGESKLAYLAYASVFPMGYEARSNVPGLVPLRSYDHWRPPFDNYHLPGTPAKSQCVFDEGDVAGLKKDMELARARSDVLIMSFHWGDFLRAYHLTEHELKLARLCIDEGAAMVVGHHHHVLRGMEWYRGKPIFYGLGHFVFDVRLELSDEAKAMFAAMPPETLGYQIGPREGWPLLPLHPESRMTVLAWARVEGKAVVDIGVLPCRLRPDGRVHPVAPGSDEGREVLAYLERCNTTQGLNGRLEAEGAPVLAGHATVRVVPKN